MIDNNLALLLDEISANATASSTIQLVDGWMLRAATDLPFRRSNCAIPLRGATADSIDEVEAFFARRNMDVYVQVSERLPELDAFLAARGYALEAATDILVADCATVVECAPASGVAVTLIPELDDAWAGAYGDVMGDDEYMADRITAYGHMMKMIGPRAFAASAPNGIGFAVVERGWVGYYGIGTTTAARRRGIGTAIMRVLTQHAIELGAPQAYLQVSADNEPAQALYAKLGFTRAYGYHYRVR